jgi:uncharacterized integral membrane protein
MRREDDQPRETTDPAAPGPPVAEDAVGQARQDQAHYRELQKERQARVAKVVTALAILVVLILFIIANAQPVKVNFVFFSRHPRLIWVMVACAVLGGVFGYLVGRPGRQIRLHRDRGQPEQPKA